jgi:hypothetical protein
MQASLSHPAPSAHPHGDLGDTPDDERLRGLTRDQLEDRLRWLSWWRRASSPPSWTTRTSPRPLPPTRPADQTIGARGRVGALSPGRLGHSRIRGIKRARSEMTRMPSGIPQGVNGADPDRLLPPRAAASRHEYSRLGVVDIHG